MRINSVSTFPLQQINRGTNPKYHANIQISFGISEHERRVKERTNDLTKNMGFIDKHIFGGKSKARQEAEKQIEAEDLNRDKELIRQATINEETKKRLADQARYTEQISILNAQNSARMAALEQAQEQHIQWQKEMYEKTEQTTQIIMQQVENFANIMKEVQAMSAESNRLQSELFKELLAARETNNKSWQEEVEKMKEELRKEYEEKYREKTEGAKRSQFVYEMYEKMHKTNSQKGFGSVAGYQKEKDVLLTHIGNSIIAERSGQPADVPNGILFYGPKGNGKSLFAKAFAEQLDCHHTKIELDIDEATNWKNLKAAAQKAQENFEKDGKRTIIRIEEFNDFAPKDSKIVSVLKSFMDDVSQKYHATIFATTNFPEKIDDILLRSGRFNVKVALAPADKKNVIEILKYYGKDFADESVNFEELAEEIVKVQPEAAFSNAKIKAIIRGLVEGQVGPENTNNSFVFEDFVKKGCKISQREIMENIKKMGADISKVALDKFLEQIKYVKML